MPVDDGSLDGVARGDEQQAAEDYVEEDVEGPVKDAQEETAVRHGDARRDAASQLIRRRPADSDKEYNRGRMAIAAGEASGTLPYGKCCWGEQEKAISSYHGKKEEKRVGRMRSGGHDGQGPS